MLYRELKKFIGANWVFIVGCSAFFLLLFFLTGMSQAIGALGFLLLTFYYIFHLWRVNVTLFHLEELNQEQKVKDVNHSIEDAVWLESISAQRHQREVLNDTLESADSPESASMKEDASVKDDISMKEDASMKEDISVQSDVVASIETQWPVSQIPPTFMNTLFSIPTTGSFERRKSYSSLNELIKIVITTLNHQTEVYSVRDFSLLISGITFNYTKFVSEINQVGIMHQVKIDQFVDQFKNVDDHLFDVRFSASESALLALNNLFDASLVGMGGQSVSNIAKQIYNFSIQSNKVTHRMRAGLEETEKSLRELQDKLKTKIDEEINSAILEKGKIDMLLGELVLMDKILCRFAGSHQQKMGEIDLFPQLDHIKEVIGAVENSFFEISRHFQLIKNIWKKKMLGNNKHEVYLNESLLLNCLSIQLESNKNFYSNFTMVEK
jgi:hypothetical protein